MRVYCKACEQDMTQEYNEADCKDDICALCKFKLLKQEPALPEPKTGICGRCYGEPVEVFPANCNEKPENLIGQPIGQYHCPDCGAMVVAGSPHPDMCQKCIDRKHPAFDLLKQEQPKPKITDVRMECLKCHRISTVGNAIPDIDGEGSLGCPFCYDKDLERVALVEQPLSDSEQVFPKPLNPAQAAMMGIMPEAIKDTTNIDKCSDCPYNPFGRETAEEKEVNDKLYNTQEPSDSEPSDDWCKKLIDFIYPDVDKMTDEEVETELRRLNIDTTVSMNKVRLALQKAKDKKQSLSEPSDSEQGEFRKTHFDEIKANAYGMETPQFCGWLYTVIYDSYAEIDRLTEEIFNIKRLCNYYDEFGEVSQPDYVLPDLADNVMGIFAELQQRIQQLEAKLAEFRAYNEGDNAIVVIEQLEKELAEAKDELENYKLEHSRRCGEIRDLKDELEQAKKTK
ncbi:MAG: hypothetical protein WC196_02950 [Bacilli bacterium]